MNVSDKPSTLRAQMKHHEPIVCYALEGNGARPSHRGAGYSDEGKMFTLNTIEKHSVCYSIEGHIVDRNTAQNGKGWAEGYAHTLNATDRHAVCYILDSYTSNSMKSKNPYSGVHEADTTKCLDTQCLNPACNQGGAVVVYGVDCRNGVIDREKTHTIQAKPQGGVSLNCTPSVCYATDARGNMTSGGSER